MNAVEIEEAISALAEAPFDAAEFPFAFLEAFGNKSTTIKKLRNGATNPSDVPGGVLQRGHIHLACCGGENAGVGNTGGDASDDTAGDAASDTASDTGNNTGGVTATLAALKASRATNTARNGVGYVLATDGQWFEAENLSSGDTIACDYKDFPNHFGFFLPLAGITTVKQIRENAFDIRATSRLNKLYVELLRHNPDWGTPERRSDMNHFMARLIFCFFAEDTDIFLKDNLFTGTIEQMTSASGRGVAQPHTQPHTKPPAQPHAKTPAQTPANTHSNNTPANTPANTQTNTHEVIGEIFRAMSTDLSDRGAAGLPRWANDFPYVNGGLFSGNTEAPRFSRMARSYLLHVGGLDWQQINPDIFGSMIQAVADEEERGALGMHYTSVPNILKVLNPLFLDDLRDQLDRAGDNGRKLLNLRGRLATIRVFDPACGSGNFLVIAYKEMRAIEHEINKRRGETHEKSVIPLTNFRGIELRDFPAEIARLALIIAEYQCDVLYRGQQEALAAFLPLDTQNWITCGNALRLDWLSICPPTGKAVKLAAHDLLHTPHDQSEIDFENEGGETYICGNPPYKGSTWQSKEQKEDMQFVFTGRVKNWKSLDYVAGWFMKAADFGTRTPGAAAFVSTNSICQGQQVSLLWQPIFETGHEISFAHTSFKWANLASHNAGVTVVIVGLSNRAGKTRRLFSLGDDGIPTGQAVDHINAYLVPGPNVIVERAARPKRDLPEMARGNQPTDGGHLLLSGAEVDALSLTEKQRARFIRRFLGSAEFIQGKERYCLWIEDDHLEEARSIEAINERIERVRDMRLKSRDKGANEMAKRSHQMREMNVGSSHTIVVPVTSSENREYLPVGLLPKSTIVSNKNFALYDAPLWNMAIIASKLHLVWIATVCGKLKTDYSYSNTLGWNTFPVPKLTEKNKEDLTRAARDILLAREAHFPATIADLYNPMPGNLRAAHDLGDEVLERIYIGRRFKNDTERLEDLFQRYTKMTATSKTP